MSLNRIDLNLQAGRKYLTVRCDNWEAGPTVELVNGAFTLEPVSAMFPFQADFDGDDCKPHYVTRDGAIFHHRKSEPDYQITAEYRAIAERMEKWRAKDRAERTQGEFQEIVEAVRKLEAGK